MWQTGRKRQLGFFDKTWLWFLSRQIKNFFLVQLFPSHFCCHRISGKEGSFVDSSFTVGHVLPWGPWCPQDKARPLQASLKSQPTKKQIPMDPRGFQKCLYHLSWWWILLVRSWLCSEALSSRALSPFPLGAISHRGWQAQEKPPTALY